MNYWFFLGWTRDEFKKYCQKNFDYLPDMPLELKGKLIESIDDRGTRMLIWTEKANDLPSLVHECVHAAHFTLDRKGFKPDFCNDEPVAYLVQSIFTAALKEVKFKPSRSKVNHDRRD